MPPPYHSISGNDITVYLNIMVDTNDNFELPNPLDALLGPLALKWKPIATALNFRLIIAPAESPGMDEDFPSPPGTALFGPETPERILYRNDVLTPPSGVDFFKFKIGVKDSARPETQSAKISYVNYDEGNDKGNGYIYSQSPSGGVDLQDIGHELGHVLGLVDRYYDAVTWYTTRAIRRTCLQIRLGNWFAAGDVDQRFFVFDNSPSTKDLPRWADRVSLIMHRNALPKDQNGISKDPDYDPDDNLMSSGTPTLTKYQMALIGINNGQVQTPQREDRIRKSDWVAILGDQDNPPFEVNHTWDGGTGLMFYPNNDETKTPGTYPCWNGKERGRAQGDIVRPDLINDAMGKNSQFIRINPKKHYEHGKRSPIAIDLRNKMCYCKRVLGDLH